MAQDGTVLVTGGGGFIGSHVCQALLRRGQGVVVIDNLDPFYDPDVKLRNLEEVRETAGACSLPFEFVRADLTDAGAVEDSLSRGDSISGVIHLAARAGVRPSLENPPGYARTNLEGTVRVFDAVRALDPAIPIAMASSSSVYGNLPTSPFSEADAVDEPISPYAATKRACELIAHTYHHLYAMPIACLRFFTVFGPRQRPDLAIAKFIERISKGQTITLFGDGSSSRDYTYIDDIVAGVLASLDRITDRGYRIWNLGGSSPTSLDEMVRTIERALGQDAVIERAPAQPGDVERTFADLTRSKAELGFEPTTSFEDGVVKQVEAYRAAQPV